MHLTSPAFDDHSELPEKFTLEGGNVSPPLRIGGVPEGTRSIALIVEDPDAPIGIFTHWLLWNIPPETTEIPENTTPPGAETGCNGFGNARYAGPCPPSGRHGYSFRLLAIDRKLDATTPDRKDQVLAEMKRHVLAEAVLTGYFQAKP